MPAMTTGLAPASMQNVLAQSTGVTILNRSLVLTIDSLHLGATPPTAATVGTTPTMDVLLFDAVAETVNVFVAMPADWNKAKGCVFNFVWSLVDAETDADTLDITVDYVAIKKNTTAAGLGKTSTQLTPTTTVTTANGLAVGDIYMMSATLSQSDGSNGYAVGDNTIGFGIEFHMTNITNVVQIHLVGCSLDYQGLY